MPMTSLSCYTVCHVQDAGQKLTYAQIIQRKKEAAEAAERERQALAAAGGEMGVKGEQEPSTILPYSLPTIILTFSLPSIILP